MDVKHVLESKKQIEFPYKRVCVVNKLNYFSDLYHATLSWLVSACRAYSVPSFSSKTK